jgi:hypothetical protein
MHPTREMRTKGSGNQPGTQAIETSSTRIGPRRGALSGRVRSWVCGIAVATALPASVAQISHDTPAASLLSEPARTWAVESSRWQPGAGRSRLQTKSRMVTAEHGVRAAHWP